MWDNQYVMRDSVYKNLVCLTPNITASVVWARDTFWEGAFIKKNTKTGIVF